MRLWTVLGSIALVWNLCSCDRSSDASASQQDQKKLQALSGTYQDAEPYAYGDAYGQRIFTFDKGRWTLQFTLGLDPQLTQPVFEFRTYGTYQVLEPSEVVDQAFNALFLEEKKFLTLKTDQAPLVAAFGLDGCGLTKDVEQDISTTGCSVWAPVAQCNEDHDLLAIDEAGDVYFGIRPPDNNMCTADRRPTALTPPVKKQ